MFKPDFTKVNAHMLLAALGQALFTLSIGMGALLTYGSYIKDDKNITKSAYTIIFSDTMFALMAGIMIFPAIFLCERIVGRFISSKSSEFQS